MLIPLLIAAVVGYFLGALPFGYLVARGFGINIFEHGSKNPGATNVKRVLGEKFGAKGKRAGNFVFLLDALKGALATGWLLVYIAWSVRESDQPRLSFSIVLAHSDFEPVAITGLIAALLGHSFSCFTKFKGGKGVATSAGGLLVLLPVATLIALGVWLATFYTSRYVSLASILAAVALPVAAFFLHQPPLITGISALIGVIVIVRHRANITRLLNGTENKFVKKTPGAPR